MNTESGFTLIELLVVMATLGVLSGLAIPQYSSSKARAFDKLSMTSVRNVAHSQELYYVESQNYSACDQTNCHILLPGLKLVAEGVSLQASIINGGTGFSITASHPAGTRSYTWDSLNKGFLN